MFINFDNVFDSITDLEGVEKYRQKLYNFKDYLGSTEGYTYFNDYYVNKMMVLEDKYNLLENTIIWLNKNNLIYDYIYCSAKKDFTIFEKFGHVDFVIDDNCDNISNIKRISGDDCIYVNIMNVDNMTNECEVDRHTELVKVLSLINK